MHFYSQSYRQVMDLPIKTFWLMSNNIERISAQQDLRSLTVAVCGQGGEAAHEHRQRLILEVGTIVKLDSNPMNAVRDEAGFEELKKLTQQ